MEQNVLHTEYSEETDADQEDEDNSEEARQDHGVNKVYILLTIILKWSH